jgi:putative transposase
LKDRHWACAQCGTPHDRDVNASINLERLATGRLESALPEAIGEMTSVRYETGQQDDSGQKPLDREERQRAQICVHFG